MVRCSTCVASVVFVVLGGALLLSCIVFCGAEWCCFSPCMSGKQKPHVPPTHITLMFAVMAKRCVQRTGSPLASAQMATDLAPRQPPTTRDGGMCGATCVQAFASTLLGAGTIFPNTTCTSQVIMGLSVCCSMRHHRHS